MDSEALREWFGPAFDAVEAYRSMLADEGVRRGLIGPREVDRLWERHILNSAAVAAYLPSTGSVVDVGSGAGLPGVVLAAMRPDLDVVLLEPMLRRTTWLTEVLDSTGIRAEVVRGRAEELHGDRHFDVVTARAVAPMDRLAAWTLPLLQPGGQLLALKGRQVADELTSAEDQIRRLGGVDPQVLEATTVPGVEPTFVARVTRSPDQPVTPPPAPATKSETTESGRGRSNKRNRRGGARRR